MLNEKELIDAFNDEEFLNKILNLENIEDVQKAFKDDRNIDISIEEIEAIQNVIVEMTKKLQNGEISQEDLENMKNGNISEDDLEKISGGKASDVIKKVVGGVVSVAAVATATVAAAYIGWGAGKAQDKPEYFEGKGPGTILKDATKDLKTGAKDIGTDIKRWWKRG